MRDAEEGKKAHVQQGVCPATGGLKLGHPHNRGARTVQVSSPCSQLSHAWLCASLAAGMHVPSRAGGASPGRAGGEGGGRGRGPNVLRAHPPPPAPPPPAASPSTWPTPCHLPKPSLIRTWPHWGRVLVEQGGWHIMPRPTAHLPSVFTRTQSAPTAHPPQLGPHPTREPEVGED